MRRPKTVALPYAQLAHSVYNDGSEEEEEESDDDEDEERGLDKEPLMSIDDSY